jgi:hypothetical protein
MICLSILTRYSNVIILLIVVITLAVSFNKRQFPIALHHYYYTLAFRFHFVC